MDEPPEPPRPPQQVQFLEERQREKATGWPVAMFGVTRRNSFRGKDRMID
jgi:hypothetical protein